MKKIREKVRIIIFEADTPSGKAFDVILFWLILFSTFCVIMESVPSFRSEYAAVLLQAEWIITILFTIEYIARIISTNQPLRYIFSFYGIIDILSILPGYLGLMMGELPSFLVIRCLRLMRVFRVLKLVNFVGEADILKEALIASRRKIIVFIYAVLAAVIIIGALMYFIEGDQPGFESIPSAIYWTIVTLTTVGYGDIVPVTVLGKTIASIVMILGYGIIAVPTGIVTAELSQVSLKHPNNTRSCYHCSLEGHVYDARFCRGCGKSLEPANPQ